MSAFIVLTFLLSFGVGLPSQRAILARGPSFVEPLGGYAARLPVVFGPALAACAIAGITGGRRGLRELLQSFRMRRPVVVYLVAAPPVTLSLAIAAYAITGTSLVELQHVIVSAWPLLGVHYILQMLIVGLGEETGWRGWLLPRLLTTHSPIAATSLVAGVWCIWHAPIYASAPSKAVACVGLLLVALSVLLTLAWSHTRSVLPAIAIHGSVNAPMFFFQGKLPLARSIDAGLAYASLFALLAGIALAIGWPWWRNPEGSMNFKKHAS